MQGLEAQYDAAVAHDGENLLADGEEMPTADELAAAFEQFLAEQQRGTEDCPVAAAPPYTITSSRVPLFSRWKPVSVQTTMSSMRAPCGPG